MTQRLSFPRTRRLSGRSAFSRVFAGKCSASNRLLVIYAAANGMAYPRLGISVGRKIGPAVVRNRVKRLIREAFRLEQRELQAGIDLVVVARTAERADLAQMRAGLREVSRRAAARVRD